MKKSGIWFYGLAGSGKTYASRLAVKLCANPFIIDGDDVRKLISQDLDFTLSDRIIQLRRLFGISQLCLHNNYFPIISSVLMNAEILSKCQLHNIHVVEIKRSRSELRHHREIYSVSSNVVGVDIKQQTLKTAKIFNDGSELFETLVEKNVR